MPKPKICITFDLEEWWLPEHYKVSHPLNGTTTFSRIGMERLLPMLNHKVVPCTFFVTGYYAERHRKQVKEILKQGHEIACHSYVDKPLLKFNFSDAEKQISKSTKIITKIIGQRPQGFRAPQFSINDDILDIVMQHGYVYDSSVHPSVVPGHYIDYRSPLDPFVRRSRDGSNSIIEIPIAVFPVVRFPISWWWMRNLGVWLTKLGTSLNLKQNMNVNLYFHPWEFTKLPNLKGVPFHISRNTGTKNLVKLINLIDYFQKKGCKFDTLESLIN